MPYGKPKAQTCNNPGCGTLIVWDNNQTGKYKFIEINNGQLHECHYSEWWKKNHPGETPTPGQGEQKTFQGKNYDMQTQRPATPDVVQGIIIKSLELLHQKIDEDATAVQSLHTKIDKLLEVNTVTNTVEFRKANTMKDNHGNESSGSDAASSGLGTVENPVHITDEQTDFEEDDQEVESH